MSFFPFIEHLRANFRLDEQDDHQERRRKIGVKLRQAGINVEGWLPIFANLLSIPTDAQFLKTMDPKVLQQRTFQAVRLLTTMDSRVRPLVLVVEDLHWADGTSLEYLPFLIDGLAAARVLVLLTYRPDFSPSWGDRPYETRIVLNRLSPAESEEMVTALLQVDRVPDEIREMIAAKTEGIPYFIEEFTKSLLESGVVVRTDGAYALMGDPRTLKVPETIQEILLGRIDRLHADVKRTMQIGAVIGRSFALKLLKAVSGLTEAELGQHVEQLKQLELIYQQGFYPEVEFVFTHALIQEVAYEGLQWEQRKELHLAIGRAIEDLARDRLEEQAATLAFHYGRSDQAERAVEYALLAGDKAASLFANSEATTYYEEALKNLRSLPPMPEHEERQIDTIVKLASVALTRQHFERDLANLEVAQAIVQRLNDQRRTAQVLYWIARNHYVRGDLSKSVELAERSLTIASESLQEEGLIVWPVNLLGRIYTANGDFVNGRLMMQRSVELLERLGNPSELSTSSSILAVALGATGEFQEAFKFSEQGLRLAREIQNLPGEAANYYYRAIVYEQKGEWSRVVEDCRAGLEIAKRIRDPFRVYVLTCLLGYGWFRLGEAKRGMDTLREGIGLAEQLGTKYLLAWAFSWLSDSYLVERSFDAALDAASRALSLAVPGSDFYGESLAARCYGEALCQKDPNRLAEAEEHIQRAIRLQAEKGMKPQLARSYVGYARLLQLKGEADKAREYLDRARALFQELDMQWHQRRLAETFG
jgi:tetratricopeptide (TPR) repeat protein